MLLVGARSGALRSGGPGSWQRVLSWTERRGHRLARRPATDGRRLLATLAWRRFACPRRRRNGRAAGQYGPRPLAPRPRPRGNRAGAGDARCGAHRMFQVSGRRMSAVPTRPDEFQDAGAAARGGASRRRRRGPWPRAVPLHVDRAESHLEPPLPFLPPGIIRADPPATRLAPPPPPRP